MVRRRLLSSLSQALGFSLLASGSADAQSSASPKRLKILMRSSWGSDDLLEHLFRLLTGSRCSTQGKTFGFSNGRGNIPHAEGYRRGDILPARSLGATRDVSHNAATHITSHQRYLTRFWCGQRFLLPVIEQSKIIEEVTTWASR